MSFSVRDGHFDVVVVAGPRTIHWPSVGVRALSELCTHAGLTVGFLGGKGLYPRGVIPLPGTGGLIFVEDSQNRVHRIHARAIVKMTPEVAFPDPFPGWRLEGLIPHPTAIRLLNESRATWNPATVVLGTGNRALQFGIHLLEKEMSAQVYAVEFQGQWGKKNYAGWEVFRRRFEVLGGKIIQGKILSLSKKAALLWELRLQDEVGIRVIDVAKIVSVGPFQESLGFREYPPSSLLFELDQTAGALPEEDIEGWALEEERGLYIGGKIVRALGESGEKSKEFDRKYRKARQRVRSYLSHLERPYEFHYDGKWLTADDNAFLQEFEGTPKSLHKQKKVASLECIEDIPCRLCEEACPDEAIRIDRSGQQGEPRFLIESNCTSCGKCLSACPAGAVTLIHEDEYREMSHVVFSWRGPRKWKVGELSILLNRKGQKLGTGRVSQVREGERTGEQWVQVEVPSHLSWQARGLKFGPSESFYDDPYVGSYFRSESEMVEITINGAKRLVREGLPISVALFELGQARPSDVLLCPDGSCKMCRVSVDGISKLGCREKIHRGMAIRLKGMEKSEAQETIQDLCPCEGISSEQVIDRLKQGKLRSAEAVLSVMHVGEGLCHGQLCLGAFKRLLSEQEISAEQWVDWRFPWVDWPLSGGPQD